MIKTLSILPAPLIADLISLAKAHAQYDPAAVVQTVSGGLGIGATNFGTIIMAVVNALVPLVYAIAALVIIRAALLLIIEQSQNELAQFKTSIISSLIAVVLVSVAQPLARALFAGPGVVPAQVQAQAVSTEILGIINFIEEPLAIIAIIMIITAGIRTVLGWGGSEGMTHLRRTIISILVGMGLIISKFAIAGAIIGTREPTPIIQEIARYLTIVLGLVTLAAVVVIIYAGFLMIVNIGKDEQYQRAKGIILRVAIGLAVILASAALAGVFLV